MDTYSYKIGAALLAFASVTSTDISSNMSMPISGAYAKASVIDTRSDGLKLTSNFATNIPKKNYRGIYKKIASSDMYKSAYSNRSLGEVTIIED